MYRLHTTVSQQATVGENTDETVAIQRQILQTGAEKRVVERCESMKMSRITRDSDIATRSLRGGIFSDDIVTNLTPTLRLKEF